MKIRDMIRAIQEYPTVCARLETVRQELALTKDDLAESGREYNSLRDTAHSQERRLKASQQRLDAALVAFQAFCPRLSSSEDLKRLYQAAAPSVDPQGFSLYRAARQLTGIDIHTLFSTRRTGGCSKKRMDICFCVI